MFKRFYKYSFFIFFIILVVTYFSKDEFRNISVTDRSLWSDPIQTPTTTASFVYKGYTITPVDNYEISGLLVHKKDNRIFNGNKEFDKIAPYDFCMVWGLNIGNETYKDQTLKFSQANYRCGYTYGAESKFINRDMSNNHLVVTSSEIDSRLKKMRPGDQIKITGKLVNIKGDRWRNSSTTREDGGDGACEQILVESAEVLTPGHPFIRALFTGSFYGLLSLCLIKIVSFIVSSYKQTKSYESMI